MQSARWVVIAALAGYAGGLTLLAPATMVDTYLRHASDGRVRLAQASGTVWSGGGGLEVRDPRSRLGTGIRVRWRLSPVSLLGGRARFEVTSEGNGRMFRVEVSPRGTECTGLALTLPAAIIGIAAPNLDALRLTGEIDIDARRMDIRSAGVQGSATVRYRGAGSALVPAAPLGDYELQVEGKGDAMHAMLRTLQGRLDLAGEATWARGSEPRVRLTARVAPQHRAELAPFLRLIAIERHAGYYEFATACC